MCFTVDQIDRACGLLLLNEFNSFIYCCKQCTCDFESGPSLEVHILSEHQSDDKEAVFGNDGVFVDSFEPTYDPINVKTEQFGSNADDLDESNVEEQVVDEVKTLVVFAINANIGNGNNSTGIDKVENEVSFEVTSIGIKELENKNDTFENVSQNALKIACEVSIPKKRSRGRPLGAKNKKKTGDESVNELIPKRKRGRPLGSKSAYRKPKWTFYCDMCPDLSFPHKNILFRHMKVRHMNTERNMKRCEICNKFPRKSYEHHMKMNHSNHQYKCDFCDVTFKLKAARDTHIRTHTLEKPFLCIKCGKAFISQSNCYTHEMFVHKIVKKHQCPHCDKAFRQQNTLQNHINAIHKKQRPHVCEICGKGFASTNALLVHKSFHGHVKPTELCKSNKNDQNLEQ